LFKSVYSINKLWFSFINLEMIFWKEYLWTDRDLNVLEGELWKIKKFNLVQLANEFSIKNHRKVLDISPDGKASDNSFVFHNYWVEFDYKNIFDQKLKLIFRNHT
jgi:hypothetical protein